MAARSWHSCTARTCNPGRPTADLRHGWPSTPDCAPCCDRKAAPSHRHRCRESSVCWVNHNHSSICASSSDGEKTFFLCAVFQWSEAERCFSSVDVLCCKATCDDVRTCVGACSQTQSHDVSTDAQRAKTSEEGFLWFLLQ